MNASRRHSAGGWLTAVALGALVLTGCGQEPTDRLEPAAAAGPAPSSTADDATDRTDGTDGTDDDRTHDSGKSADPVASREKAAPSARADDRTGDGTSDRADTARKSAAPSPSPAPDRRTAAPTAPKDTSATTGKAPFSRHRAIRHHQQGLDRQRAHLPGRSARPEGDQPPIRHLGDHPGHRPLHHGAHG